MMMLEEIELLAKEHAADRALLAERVGALNEEIDSAKRRRLPGIKSAVSKAKDSQLRLQAAIDGHRSLFEKPRTRVFHGIKVGLQKAKGKLTFSSAADVVKLIKKHFTAEQAELLIKTTEKPAKDALIQLPAADLKKLGCTLVKSGDEVVIKPTDSEVDKLVEVLLGDGEEENLQEDAA